MADMSTPLTALCNICHSEPPKYTCPRDRVRTCSLACSQAHKRRAACTGLRDPSAYMSKSALSTAGGIDRDYNFLSSVERNMDRADKETSERGVSLSGQGKAGFHKRWHDNGALARYLREHGIEVHKAPIGMARQKANQTRFIQKSRRIVWSVEWVVDGEKRMAEVDESRTMEQAYQELVLEKERESKKRKRAPDGGAAKIQKQKIQPENADVMKHLQNKAVAEEVTSNAEVATQTKSEKSTELGVAEVAPSTDKIETIDPSSADRQAEPPENEPSSPKKTPHFYLHKPHTSSKNTVLIPITASTTLTNALQHKDVLEFPTFYVFTTQISSEPAPHTLPDGYITLNAYKHERDAEDEELMGLMEAMPEGQRKIALNGAIFGGGEEKREEVDEKQILDVLQRDAEALKQ